MKWTGPAGGGPGAARGGGSEGSGKHEAEDLRSILGRWMKKNRIRERVKEESIYGRWADLVGDEIAGMTRPIRQAAGILTVEVASPPLLQELSTFRRREIVDRIRSLPEFSGIRDIRFWAGKGEGSRGGAEQGSGGAERDRTRRI